MNEAPDMMPEIASASPSNSRRLIFKMLKIVILFLMLVTIIVGGWFGYNFYKKSQTAELEGTVYLTLRDDMDGYMAGLFGFDLTQNSFGLIKDDGALNMTERLSPDGQTSAYASRPASELNNPETPVQIYIDGALSGGQVKQVTKSETKFKRLPAWSSDSLHIAFMADHTSSTTAPSKDLKDWAIYVTDLEGNETFVGEGAYPAWVSDTNHLLALRDFGLVLYNLDDGSARQVWSVAAGGKASLNNQLAISPAGDMVAWTSPDIGKVTLFKVTDPDQFTLEIYKQIDTHSFWPVFSPDGEKLVYESVDWNSLQDNPQPKLEVYTLATGESMVLGDLSRYDQEAMFISDWK